MVYWKFDWELGLFKVDYDANEGVTLFHWDVNSYDLVKLHR